MTKIREESQQDANMSIVESGDAEGELSYEERLVRCTEIAKPMSSKKTLGRIRKLIKKAAKDVKGNIAYGIKSVQSSLRKGVTGIVLIDGSVQPIDTLCHIPGVCEEKNIPYIYVTCNTDLAGGKITRSHIMLIKPNPEYQEAYDKVLEDIKNTPVDY